MDIEIIEQMGGELLIRVGYGHALYIGNGWKVRSLVGRVFNRSDITYVNKKEEALSLLRELEKKDGNSQANN